MYRLKITDELAGKRSDKLLAEQLPQFPRTALTRLFDKNLVWLNGKPTKPGHKLRTGDSLSADLSPLDIKIEDIELPILYEDDDVLVINKPSGVISHARGKYFDEPSVASFIRQKTGQKGERSGIVHRLDRATSGVMICAKNQETLVFLQKQFSLRKVNKTYIAIIEGSPPTDKGTIDMPIGRSLKTPAMFRVTEDGKQALTHYRTIAKQLDSTTLELSPETGRTHQLRVHLKHLGHPIVGDILYGGRTASRLMLHAARLEITLPGGRRTTFRAPIPNDFQSISK